MFDECLYFNSTALARIVEKEWSGAFDAFDLTPAQGFALRTILAHPGSLASEIASQLGIARPTATRVFDQLESKGQIQRSPSGRDNRQLLIVPTPLARRIRPDLERASAEVTKRMKARLGNDLFRSTVQAVRTVRTKLELS
jgi:DNA-binding MarR family transcriptional regulator